MLLEEEIDPELDADVELQSNIPTIDMGTIKYREEEARVMFLRHLIRCSDEHDFQKVLNDEEALKKIRDARELQDDPDEQLQENLLQDDPDEDLQKNLMKKRCIGKIYSRLCGDFWKPVLGKQQEAREPEVITEEQQRYIEAAKHLMKIEKKKNKKMMKLDEMSGCGIVKSMWT